MNTITYAPLTKENFQEESLDDFIRRQNVTECWRKNRENQYVLVPNAYTEDWDPAARKEKAREIIETIECGGFAYGAFCEGRVVGFILVSGGFFGSRRQYVELVMFHVSEPWRNRGIGKALFKLACGTARERGAQKLYISAQSSRESQAAYRRLGCVEAVEINPTIAENEPYDVQLEFVL